jgi:hypothetical protein
MPGSTRLLTLRRILLGTALSSVTVAGLAFAAPASALVPVFSATPTTLPAGQSVAVDGTNCSGAHGQVTVGLYAGTTAGNALPGGSPVTSLVLAPSAGTWAGSVTVPIASAPGAYTLHASCSSDTNDFTYENVAVTVTSAPTTTTAVTTTVQGTTTTTAATSTTLAAPAIAVAAQPTFTG